MKKKSLIIIAVLCLALLAVACNNQSNNQSNEQAQDTEFTKAKLTELYNAHTGAQVSPGDAFIDMNYNEITAIFGMEPTKEENDGEVAYHYIASDDENAKVTFLFEDINGVLDCTSASKNFH